MSRDAIVNLDFATGEHADRQVLKQLAEKYDFIFCVEAKVDNLKQITPQGFKAYQVMLNEGTKGNGIVHRQFFSPSIRRAGITLGVNPNLFSMNTRYLMYIDVALNSQDVVRKIVCHYPPGRYQGKSRIRSRTQLAIFRHRVKKLIRSAPQKGKWSVNADFNLNVHSEGKRLGGVGHGVGIIGIVVGPNMRFSNLEVMDQFEVEGFIDHVAIGGTVYVRG